MVAGALAQQAPSRAERETHWMQDLRVLSSGLKAPGIRITAGIATHREDGDGIPDRLPVEFHWFSDGRAVSVETAEYSALPGASVSLPFAPGDVKKIAIAEGLRIPPVLYRSHPNSWYWIEYLADSQTIFIQYNQCANDSTHHFIEVVRQAMAEADWMRAGRHLGKSMY
jgi:hypothetical protein